MTGSSHLRGAPGAVHAATTLERVLQDLGTTFLMPLDAEPDLTATVGGIAMHDPLDEQAIPHGAIVLGVGLAADQEVRSLVDRIAESSGSALVLREPVIVDTTTQRRARDAGVVLLGLPRGASWTQLGAMLSSILSLGTQAHADGTIGGVASGDLFTLANAIAALVDAPVTIEDRSSRVLAFSGNQDEADAGRVTTILERQVPERFSRLLAEAGVFRRLYASAEPIFIPLDGILDEITDSTVPRTAIAVRAGDELLGSIWAATPERLSGERSTALAESAKLVAMHLLRLRAGGDAERRLRADLVSTALEGSEGRRRGVAHRRVRRRARRGARARAARSRRGARRASGGGLALLLEHDRAHGSELVETLRAWLDHMADRILPSKGLAVTLLTNGGHSRDLYGDLYRELFAALAGVEMAASLQPADGEADVTPFVGTYERASVRMEVLPAPAAGEPPILRATTTWKIEAGEPESTDYPLHPVEGDLFATRPPGTETWMGVRFYSLPTGERYVHFGARATPKVA